jgi:hypothetical protein
LFASQVFPFTVSSLTWAHAQVAHVEVSVSGTLVGVTINISGSLNGATQTEQLVILVGESGYARSVGIWNAVSSVSSSSVSGATIETEMSFPSGQPAVLAQTITSNVRIRKQQHRFPLLVETPQGQTLKQRWLAFANDFPVQANDLLEIAGTIYQVEAVQTVFNLKAAHHLELDLQKLL